MLRILSIAALAVGLSACAQLPTKTISTSERTDETQASEEPSRSPRADLAIIEPLPASRAAQSEVAQISMLLEGEELSEEQRPVALYRRGVLYDQMGLPALAMLSMNQVIELDPRFFDAWHYMGIYYMQHGDYQRAYEAFDSVLELSPEHEYVYLNRGLASYYDQQFDLALNDLADFYFQNTSDPYRIIWYYFAFREVNETRAVEQLSSNRDDIIDDPWGLTLVDYFLGRVSEQQLMNRAFDNVESHRQLLERLCEAYFYLGKEAAMANENNRAMNFFKLSLMTNIYDFIEYRVARTELTRLRSQDSEQAQGSES
ncbi:MULTISPECIES: lipoprotein NlpI [Gammaproteobacteria]|uniref:lipoprotein NlpI n=1 Tax=Gammaproteobacteria TaxID=1236 RepID=UPI000DD03E9E|nr:MULTISPECIES: lipoprotein NlpI [Gammaproteobacteria]RTE87465.1 tetratricopeptide repeat protein [Aliidiomarina sp. B3213]TCZ92750.1 tetratricopeptide repeat protein [Lysobacter sp. N42]